MLGDVLLINDQHKSAARTILKRVIADLKVIEQQDPAYKFVVAISGESGAGKSELAHSLALLLKERSIRVKVLHTDNYYLVPPLERREHRISNGYTCVGFEEYDWELLHTNIDDFRNNRQVFIPCIDIITEEIDQLFTDFSKVQLLIIDGLYAIRTEDIDLRVFIDLTYHETKISQVVRCKEPADGYRWEVLEREHHHVRSLKSLADMHVNNNYDVVDACVSVVESQKAKEDHDDPNH
ncbi:MAG: uridine kinase [Chlorobium phaeobacteroides]|uniref:Phosphoribulokinase/uridine kinase n=1 Tax=Chlorobium phaeobacteroides (strain BS1) TaxID=331678 RepID=B3EN87_CHLPB|nr:uridine kinase [Chlorobium phaeobacteroides]MBL6956808.1 uridine kinase [Chlorobium phaeobacteroides]